MLTEKRKLLSLVSLILVFVFLSVPSVYGASNATEGKCGPSVYWNFDSVNGVLTIYGEGPMYDYAHFSNAVDCAPYSTHRANIKKIVIEEGVTKLGSYAFSGFTYVTLVDFPESSLEIIGAYAFNYCGELTKIIIPDSVYELGEYVFTTCQKLKVIRFGAGITSIPAGACFRASELLDVYMTENCKYIGSSAFYECSKLVNIDISSVETIDANCFYSCKALKSVRFGENIKVIGTNSLYACSALEEIIFDGTPESIPSSFCYGSVWYNSHAAGMYTICDGTILMCRNPYEASEIVVPDGVKMISDSAFANNTSITKVTLPEGLEVIGNMAFSRTDNLQSITIPDSVKEIRKNALGYKTEGTSSSVVNPNFVITAKGKGPAYVYAVQNGVAYNCLHQYENVIESENCTEAVYSLKTCVYCDVVIEKSELPVNESHSLKVEVVMPDCENSGYTVSSCENCSYSVVSDETAATGHVSSGKWELVSAPTCDEFGMFGIRCNNCDEILSKKLIEKKGHTEASALRVVSKETCEEDGIYEKYCKTCSAVIETVIVPAVGHIPMAEYETVIEFEEGSAGCEMIRCESCALVILTRWFVMENGEKIFIDKNEARKLCLDSMGDVFVGSRTATVSNYDFNFDGKLNAKDKISVKLMTE